LTIQFAGTKLPNPSFGQSSFRSFGQFSLPNHFF